jgi:hypothetical protein
VAEIKISVQFLKVKSIVSSKKKLVIKKATIKINKKVVLFLNINLASIGN